MLQTQSRLFTLESFTRVTWLVSRLEQELLTLSGAPEFTLFTLGLVLLNF
jgi:hypothetical protein